ncbi:MAG TPA: Crp/Fnr family transcriptional regulator [Ottowia sp.]|uniref:Crp/Fnr family transcriptional regulator n=1 Tax=Ottowia sp. TaxID=1898956 RepID=UPI002C15AF6C|nr:Crp/Fnr family transcriptional regulator [Ottowia sp.]HMN21392.1 Crp/Fnr family transcriptional regulator [Ottowia sp.]
MNRRAVPTATLLAQMPLFSSLSPAALEQLAGATLTLRPKAGEVLFDQGEPARGIYLVVYGDIKLISTTPVRGSRLTGLAHAGESFGEPVLFLERPTLVRAQAACDALVLMVPAHAVVAELDRNPKFARQMIAGLSRRVQSLVSELDQQALSNGSARFAAYLTRQAQGARSLSWTLPTTKSQIASQLNVTPEHFSRILRDLAAAGLLEVQGRRIIVPDMDRLRRGAR